MGPKRAWQRLTVFSHSFLLNDLPSPELYPVAVCRSVGGQAGSGLPLTCRIDASAAVMQTVAREGIAAFLLFQTFHPAPVRTNWSHKSCLGWCCVIEFLRERDWPVDCHRIGLIHLREIESSWVPPAQPTNSHFPPFIHSASHGPSEAEEVTVKVHGGGGEEVIHSCFSRSSHDWSLPCWLT